MKRIKLKYRFLSFIVSALLIFGSALTVYAQEGTKAEGDLIKEYEFKVSKSDEYSFDDAPDEIKEKGKKYELRDIRFEVIKDNRIEEVRRVYTTDQEKYEKEIEKTISGEKIKLKAEENINWKPVDGKEYEAYREYADKNSIPSQIIKTVTEEDVQYEAALELQDVKEKIKTERFSVPAVFYAPSKSSTRYSLDGKIVAPSDSSPIWSGYEEDVSEYLGLNGSSYHITGGNWEGELEYDGTNYIRKAIYTGTKETPIYTAVYSTQYMADITYYAYYGEGIVKAFAIYDKAFGFVDILKIGAGVAIIALAAAYMIFALGRRGKKTESKQTN